MDIPDLLEEASPPEGWTVAEILEKKGWKDTPFSRNKVRTQLGALISAGRWAHAGDKMVPRIDGRMNKVPVYRKTA